MIKISGISIKLTLQLSNKIFFKFFVNRNSKSLKSLQEYLCSKLNQAVLVTFPENDFRAEMKKLIVSYRISQPKEIIPLKNIQKWSNEHFTKLL